MDSLSLYTIEMWNILTDVILQEWFGIRFPAEKLPWEGSAYLPDDHRLLDCLDYKNARQIKVDIDRRYFPLNREDDCMSIFAGYGLQIPNDIERERDGFSFLARQSDYFQSLDDYIFIVQKT